MCQLCLQQWYNISDSSGDTYVYHRGPFPNEVRKAGRLRTLTLSSLLRVFHFKAEESAAEHGALARERGGSKSKLMARP